MLIRDIGLILSCKKFSENLVLIKIFSQKNGFVSGLYRPKSKKKKFNLEKVHFEWRAKSRDKLGFFKIEVDYDNFDFQEDYFSSLMKASMCELSILFLADNEVNQEIYSSMNDLLIFLERNKLESISIKCQKYIFWEICLLKNIGYGLDLEKCALSGKKDGLKYISPKSGRAVNFIYAEPYKEKLFFLPAFFINEKENILKNDLINGLNIINHFFHKAIEDLNIRKEKVLIFRKEIFKKIESFGQ